MSFGPPAEPLFSLLQVQSTHLTPSPLCCFHHWLILPVAQWPHWPTKPMRINSWSHGRFESAQLTLFARLLFGMTAALVASNLFWFLPYYKRMAELGG